MTVELVQLIREAENKAEAIIREAQQKGRQSFKEAQSHAAEKLQAAGEEAEKQAKALIRQAEDDAHLDAGLLVQEQRGEIDRLKTKAEANLSAAVTMITERIVNFYAHS